MNSFCNTHLDRILRPSYSFPYILGMSIADRLRQTMQDRRLTNQSALARMSQVPQPTINRILTGKSPNPDSDTVSKLAIALSVSYEWLLTGRGEAVVGFAQKSVPEVKPRAWPFSKIAKARFDALPDTEKDRVEVFLIDTIKRWEASSDHKKRAG